MNGDCIDLRICHALDCSHLVAGNTEYGAQVDVSIWDVLPDGAMASYASLEQLRSLVARHVVGEKYCLINGPASDMWSAGEVLYELLTKQLPFGDEGDDSDEYDGILEKQCKWVSAHMLDYWLCLNAHLA